MTFEQIVKLANMGLTYEQIKSVNGIVGAEKKADVIPEQKVEPKHTEIPEHAEESETIRLLRELTGLVRGNNINSLTHAGQSEERAEDILASILDP